MGGREGKNERRELDVDGDSLLVLNLSRMYLMLLRCDVRTEPGAHPASWVGTGPFPGVTRPEHDTDHLVPS